MCLFISESKTAITVTNSNEYSSADTGAVNCGDVSMQCRNFIEHLVAAFVIAVVDHLTVRTKWLPVLLPLVSNEVVLAVESLVTVLILATVVLDVGVSVSAAITTDHQCCLFLTSVNVIPLHTTKIQ